MQATALSHSSKITPVLTAKVATGAYHDPRDSNQDGVVSAAEKLAYSLSHPDWTAKASAPAAKPALHSYTRKGALTAKGRTADGRVDLLA